MVIVSQNLSQWTDALQTHHTDPDVWIWMCASVWCLFSLFVFQFVPVNDELCQQEIEDWPWDPKELGIFPKHINSVCFPGTVLIAFLALTGTPYKSWTRIYHTQFCIHLGMLTRGNQPGENCLRGGGGDVRPICGVVTSLLQCDQKQELDQNESARYINKEVSHICNSLSPSSPASQKNIYEEVLALQYVSCFQETLKAWCITYDHNV